MIAFNAQDLLFLSQLELKLQLEASEQDGHTDRPYWLLRITTEDSSEKKTGLLYGARGELRKFYKLNTLVEFCKKYAGNSKEICLSFN